MAAGRNLNQPSFNFFTGETEDDRPAPAPSFRETLRQSVARPPVADAGNEELRAQINTLQYELESLKQEREMNKLNYQAELRDAQSKADAEYKRAQVSMLTEGKSIEANPIGQKAAESASKAATSKYDAVVRELHDTQTRMSNEKLELERKVRNLQEKASSLQEDADEAQNELMSMERQSKHRYNELETRYNTLQQSFDDLRSELTAQTNALQAAQQKLSKREAEVGEMESELIRFKAQAGDQDTLAVLKRELSEQVAHIRKLEGINRNQAAELKQFRNTLKTVEVVEEEKRSLESKVRMMEDLRRELSEEHLKRQILEDEKKEWAAYLESESSTEGELQFESPADLARAYVRQRLETASLTERLGAVQPELTVKEETIKALEDDKAKLKEELEKAKTGGGAADTKARLRLERQLNLASKEVEFLREQLKMVDAEESEFRPETFDAVKTNRIRELEDLVTSHRAEITTLNAELKALEELARKGGHDVSAGDKRSRDESDDERIGELRRKNRKLQDELHKLSTDKKALETELKAQSKQLSSLKASSRTRVLELRSNPTADAEALKLATVRTLREENKALLAQLEGQLAADENAATVPLATLNAARDEIAELRRTMASREKSTLRYKQIYAAKALEFKEAVASILGWELEFMPNGRVRCTSLYYPGNSSSGNSPGGKNSIVFDGENGTMKVSGGPQSVFANEIRGQIEFWVEQRKEIPCFLAQLTLDFWEATTRAG